VRLVAVRSGNGVLVEQRFLHVWSRWPLMVAMDSGGYFCNDWSIRLAHLETCLQHSASSSMERHRLKRAACANLTRSAVVAHPRVVLAW